MASFYGDNNPNEKSIPGSKVDNGDVRGKIRVLYDKFNVNDSVAPTGQGRLLDQATNADKIIFGGLDLPDGARIHDVVIKLSGATFPTAGNMNFGLGSDADAFFAAQAVTAATTISLKEDGPTNAGYLAKLSAKDTIEAAVSTDLTVDSDFDIEIAIYFTEE
jgi:hypothetical protein